MLICPHVLIIKIIHQLRWWTASSADVYLAKPPIVQSLNQFLHSYDKRVHCGSSRPRMIQKALLDDPEIHKNKNFLHMKNETRKVFMKKKNEIPKQPNSSKRRIWDRLIALIKIKLWFNKQFYYQLETSRHNSSDYSNTRLSIQSKLGNPYLTLISSSDTTRTRRGFVVF